MKHFICKPCGNLVATVNYTGKKLSCCGKEMIELTPNVTDASKEKHVPSIKQDGGRVRVYVGEAAGGHPMDRDHSVSWVSLVTDKGNQRKVLNPDEKPEAVFYIGEDERVIKAFAFCNLHGLWVTECK